MVVEAVNSLDCERKNTEDLKRGEVQKLAIKRIIERIERTSQQNLFKAQIIETANQEYDAVVEELISKIIPKLITTVIEAWKQFCSINWSSKRLKN